MDLPFSDMLRWLLLGIGVVVIAVVYWLFHRGQRQSPASRRIVPDVAREGLDESEHDAGVRPHGDEARVADAPGDDTPADKVPEMSASETGGGLRAEQRVAPPLPFEHLADTAAADSGLHSRLLVLHVRSKSKQKFSGADIMRIAEQERLELAAGSGGGFFRRNAPSPDDPPLFYIANMFSPGVFKWAEMDSFSTSGLSLFAQLPGALPPLKAFDTLLECARRFADDLQGAVCDESRSDLTVQTIQHIKEDLQAYAMGRAAPANGK